VRVSPGFTRCEGYTLVIEVDFAARPPGRPAAGGRVLNKRTANRARRRHADRHIQWANLAALYKASRRCVVFDSFSL
jgi:hypothetical protein